MQLLIIILCVCVCVILKRRLQWTTFVKLSPFEIVFKDINHKYYDDIQLYNNPLSTPDIYVDCITWK